MAETNVPLRRNNVTVSGNPTGSTLVFAHGFGCSQEAIPTLVLQSRQDVIAPPEVGRLVRDAIPGSRYAELDTTGHVPILSAPDEVAAQIRRFVS